jgi:hypothetical protein
VKRETFLNPISESHFLIDIAPQMTLMRSAGTAVTYLLLYKKNGSRLGTVEFSENTIIRSYRSQNIIASTTRRRGRRPRNTAAVPVL